jgi:hypothetical protein
LMAIEACSRSVATAGSSTAQPHAARWIRSS